MDRVGKPSDATALPLLALILILAIALPLQAHGIGTPQRINEPSGPYLVSIWTDPDPLTVDEMHVVVAVMDPETRGPLVEDVEVTVSLSKGSGGDAPVTKQASAADSTNQLLFTSVFNDELSPGEWHGTVALSGPAGRGEDLDFVVNVEAPQRPIWLWAGVAAVTIALLFWIGSAMRSGLNHLPDHK